MSIEKLMWIAALGAAVLLYALRTGIFYLADDVLEYLQRHRVGIGTAGGGA
jgi:hypothetical protein